MILTGGPGTGKTTTVKGVIAMFEKYGLKVVCAAPDRQGCKKNERGYRKGSYDCT